MKRKPPIKGNFTDGAKRRAGVQVSNFEIETARIKAQHQIETELLKHRITVLEGAIACALEALDDGRRGDGVKALRRTLPQPAKPSAPVDDEPPEPRRA